MLALSFSACGEAYFHEDEARAGLLLDWGDQVDRQGVEALVAGCQDALGFRFTPGAAVKFVADANRGCAIPSDQPVAGCWLPDFDLIVLEPADPLSRTALCHELLHRELYAREGDPDYRHLRPEWKKLPPTR